MGFQGLGLRFRVKARLEVLAPSISNIGPFCVYVYKGERVYARYVGAPELSAHTEGPWFDYRKRLGFKTLHLTGVPSLDNPKPPG